MKWPCEDTVKSNCAVLFIALLSLLRFDCQVASINKEVVCVQALKQSAFVYVIAISES